MQPRVATFLAAADTAPPIQKSHVWKGPEGKSAFMKAPLRAVLRGLTEAVQGAGLPRKAASPAASDVVGHSSSVRT